MPRLSRRAGTVGLVLTMWDVWKRIPPTQRKLIMKQAGKQARKHGPKLAAAAMAQAQARRRKRP